MWRDGKISSDSEAGDDPASPHMIQLTPECHIPKEGISRVTFVSSVDLLAESVSEGQISHIAFDSMRAASEALPFHGLLAGPTAEGMCLVLSFESDCYQWVLLSSNLKPVRNGAVNRTDTVLATCLNREGSLLAVAGQKGLDLHDLSDEESWRYSDVLPSSIPWITDVMPVVFSNCGTSVACGGSQLVVCGLDGGLRWRIDHETADMCRTSSGNILSSDKDNVRLHDIHTGKELGNIRSDIWYTRLAACPGSDRVLLMGGADAKKGLIQVWSESLDTKMDEIECDEGWPFCAAIRATNDMAAVGFPTGTIQFYALE